MSFFCNKCKKKYQSYQSLWNHNKKFHIIDNKQYISSTKLIETNLLACEYCNKNFVNKYSLNTHKLSKCYIKKYNEENNIQNNKQIDNNLNLNNNEENNEENNKQIDNNLNLNNSENTNEIKLKLILAEIESDKVKIESEKVKLQIIEKEKETLELKIKFEKLMQNKLKMHPKTFKSLNNKLINNSINSNNTINNITNNFQIIALGKENLLETLTLNEKKEIMKSRFSCLEKIVDIVHCSNYNQFKSIVITNLKDDFAYKYDDKKGYFICFNKNELISELVDERLENIKEIYEELSETNKIDLNTKKLIQDFLNKIEDNEKHTDDIDGITYTNFKSYKQQKVKILIYNNADKISCDLAVILDTNDNENENNNILNI
jgi:hypothetical protein